MDESFNLWAADLPTAATVEADSRPDHLWRVRFPDGDIHRVTICGSLATITCEKTGKLIAYEEHTPEYGHPPVVCVTSMLAHGQATGVFEIIEGEPIEPAVYGSAENSRAENSRGRYDVRMMSVDPRTGQPVELTKEAISNLPREVREILRDLFS